MAGVLWRLRRTPLRTVLTLLQVGLGALAMTLALSAYLGAFTQQNAAQAERFDLIAGYQNEDGSGGTNMMMEPEGAAEIAEIAPDVVRVALYGDIWNPTVNVDGKLYQFQKGAYVDNAYFELNDMNLTRGSLFTEQEAKANETVLLISDDAAEILFQDTDPLSQSLTLMPEKYSGGRPQSFRIIGTFAVATGSSTATQRQAHIYLPSWTRGRDEGGSDTLNVLAKAGRGNAAREQVLNAARQVYGPLYESWSIGEGKDFYIREMGESDFGVSTDLIDPIVVMFGLFGVVALIVGAIGIFSIMVVDALERERDIGIRRALGATRRRITGDLTLEAALLSGLGGLVGVLAAALIIPLLARQVGDSLFWSVDLRWQPLAALIVVGLTLALGAVLGFFPALRAGRTRITEVLNAT